MSEADQDAERTSAEEPEHTPGGVREDQVKSSGPKRDPVIEALWRELFQLLLQADPDLRLPLLQEGWVMEARQMVRVILAERGFAVELDDSARIEACDHLPTLRWWCRRALTAKTVAEVLQ